MFGCLILDLNALVIFMLRCCFNHDALQLIFHANMLQPFLPGGAPSWCQCGQNFVVISVVVVVDVVVVVVVVDVC